MYQQGELQMKKLLLTTEEQHLLTMEDLRLEGREAIFRIEGHLRTKVQNLEESFSMYIKDEESEEEILEEEERHRKYCLSYAKEHKLKGECEELTILLAEQHMDEEDFTYSSSAKESAPVRIRIQKKYEDDTGAKEVWFDMTPKDLGLGRVHKVERKGYEFRVPYIFKMDADEVIKRDHNGGYRVDATAVINGLSEKNTIRTEIDGNYSYRDVYENYLWYIAGGHGEPIELDGESFRVVIQHSTLGKVIDVDYEEGYEESHVEIDSNVIAVQPKEKYAANDEKQKENMDDSNQEIMFGKANEVILGSTQLYFSEWEEHKKRLQQEEKTEKQTAMVRMSLTSKKTEVTNNPYYSLIMQMNHMAENGMFRELSAKVKEIKEEADEILAFARANKKFVYLAVNKEDFRLSPYTLVKSFATRIEKKRRVDEIDEAVKQLVREIKATHNLELITKDNAQSILDAARAGGECRFDKEHKSIYLHVRGLVNNEGPVKVEVKKVNVAKEKAEARAEARKTA